MYCTRGPNTMAERYWLKRNKYIRWFQDGRISWSFQHLSTYGKQSFAKHSGVQRQLKIPDMTLPPKSMHFKRTGNKVNGLLITWRKWRGCDIKERSSIWMGIEKVIGFSLAMVGGHWGREVWRNLGVTEIYVLYPNSQN